MPSYGAHVLKSMDLLHVCELGVAVDFVVSVFRFVRIQRRCSLGICVTVTTAYLRAVWT